MLVDACTFNKSLERRMISDGAEVEGNPIERMDLKILKAMRIKILIRVLDQVVQLFARQIKMEMALNWARKACAWSSSPRYASPGSGYKDGRPKG